MKNINTITLRYLELEKYVDKVFNLNYSEVRVIYLLGGLTGTPFYMCKWEHSDDVYCASVLEVIARFDDNYKPLNDEEQLDY